MRKLFAAVSVLGMLSLVPLASGAASCSVRGPLPDPACTPGGALSGVTREMVCASGYATRVRNVPESMKRRVYAAYGITSRQPGQYEVDHLVSLELGGSNDVRNLWPEAAEPRPGFYEKDRVEDYVHRQVCAGLMSLPDAQAVIATDWTTVQVPGAPRQGSTASSSAISTVSSSSAGSSSSAACRIKGNIGRGGERIYHLPSCPGYARTNVSAPGERWFCSESEAAAAGWRKAGNCR